MRRGVINLEAVTAYSYDPDKECYKRSTEKRLSCYSVNRISPGKRTEYEGNIVLRIFTERDISISVGDRIALYNSTSDRPPSDAHKVIAIVDNRRGVSKWVRHWRLELE